MKCIVERTHDAFQYKNTLIKYRYDIVLELSKNTGCELSESVARKA